MAKQFNTAMIHTMYVCFKFTIYRIYYQASSSHFLAEYTYFRKQERILLPSTRSCLILNSAPKNIYTWELILKVDTNKGWIIVMTDIKMTKGSNVTSQLNVAYNSNNIKVTILKHVWLLILAQALKCF